MKIAYLLLAHMEPNLYKRLIDILTSNGDYVFLHIDKKIDSKPFEEILSQNSQCVIIQKRVTITWGGFNMVQAFLNCAEAAMQIGGFDRYYFLSGLEYPIHCNEFIHEFFEKNKNVNFINAFDALDKNRSNNKNWLKYYYYWDYDNMNLFKRIRRLFFRILYKLGAPRIRFKRKTIKSNGREYKLYDGWTTINLTEECMKFVLDFDKANPRFKKYFKTVFAPDESYIHTIIFNSHYVPTTTNQRVLKYDENARNLTFFDYTTLIKVFTNPDDYQMLLDSGCLFFRKVREGQSDKLMDYIDKRIDDERKKYR